MSGRSSGGLSLRAWGRRSPYNLCSGFLKSFLVVPVFSVPQPDGSYAVTYEPEVAIEDTGDRDADVYRITAHCTAILERWIRRHPEIWLWMHRRWKTVPGKRGAPELT